MPLLEQARRFFEALNAQERDTVASMIAPTTDIRTPIGTFTGGQVSAFAQFEREVMLERQRAGVQKAKREGKYRGRKPTARAKADDVVRLTAEGAKVADIARTLRIGRASVYRALEET
jgi:DNA invertase Pin-like site-specific DNA recombinase